MFIPKFMFSLSLIVTYILGLLTMGCICELAKHLEQAHSALSKFKKNFKKMWEEL